MRSHIKKVSLGTTFLTGLNILLGLSVSVSVGSLLAPRPANANDECGAAAGVPLSVVCAVPDPGEFSTGITYMPDGGLEMLVKAGISINTSASGDETSGINIHTTDVLNNDPVTVILEAGSSIITNGISSRGLDVVSKGDNDITIISGANVSSTHPSIDHTIQTSSISAFIGPDKGYGGTGNIRIEHLSGSTIEITGKYGHAILGRTDGTGNVTIDISGTVKTEGYGIYGILAEVNKSTSAGNTTVILNQDAYVNTNGYSAAPVLIENRGTGRSEAHISGKIFSEGEFSYGVAAYSHEPTGSADIVVTVSPTGNIETLQYSSYGINVEHKGSGNSFVESQGTISTQGEWAGAIDIFVWDDKNFSSHEIVMKGNSSSTASGYRSHGANIETAGGGTLRIRLEDNSTISTQGDKGNGMSILAHDAGTLEITQAPGTSITATGAQSFGISAQGPGTVSITADGPTKSTGNYGIGVIGSSSASSAIVDLGAGANITGGWQNGLLDTGADTLLPSAGVMVGGTTAANLNNAGTISAGSDRAVADPRNWIAGGAAPLLVSNSGSITGYVDFAATANNVFTNQAGGSLDLRHFADIDGNGTRDIKRVALSDFGHASSVFTNYGTVRLAPVFGAMGVGLDHYYNPTTGIDNRNLDPIRYTPSANGTIQAQMTGLGQFQHYGTLDLRGNAIGNSLVMTSNPAAGGAPGTGLFISNGGRLFLKTELTAGLQAGGTTGSYSDMLVVDGTALGTAPTSVFLEYNGSVSGENTPGNGIQLVEVRNKALSAPGVFVLGNRVAGSAYEYSLYHNGVGADAADGNWYLRSSFIPPTPEPPIPEPPLPEPPLPEPPLPEPPLPEPPLPEPPLPEPPLPEPPLPEPPLPEPPLPEPPLPEPPLPQPPVVVPPAVPPVTDPGNIPAGEVWPVVPGSPTGPTTPIELPNYRPETPTYMVAPALASHFGLAMLSNYHDRLGEDFNDQRISQDESRRYAAWARVTGRSGKVGSNGGSAVSQMNRFHSHGATYDYDLYLAQIGIDLYRRIDDDGARNIAGLYFGAGRVEADVNGVYGGKAGTAKLNAYSIGGYWTHKKQDGRYLDAVLQGSLHQSKARSRLGQKLDSDGWGLTTSIEAGMPIDLGDGWTVEPQAQLIYQRVSLDNGYDSFANIHYKDSNSFHGRLGLRIPRQWQTEDGRQIMAWGRLNLWHDFSNSTTTRFTDRAGLNPVSFKTDTGGTTGEIQLGISAELTARLRGFASVDYRVPLDDRKGHSYGGRAGLKYVW